MDTDEPSGTATTGKGRFQRATMTQSMTELLSLIPILLASPTAPLLPPFPDSNTVIPPPASLGYATLIKVHRFLQQHPAETSSHLAVLKCANIVLAELELNSGTRSSPRDSSCSVRSSLFGEQRARPSGKSSSSPSGSSYLS